MTTNLMLVAGCSVGPDFRLPEVPEPRSLAALEVIDQGTREMTDMTPATEWWKSFADPRLDALIVRALDNNQDLEVAKERIHQARAARRVSSSLLVPQANGTLSASRTSDSWWGRSEERGGGKPPITDFNKENVNTQSNYFLGGETSWEMDVWGKNARGLESARAEVLGAESAYRGVVLTLLAEVSLAYFDTMASQEDLDILREEVRNRQEFLKLVRTREENGLASRLDTRRQEVEDANTRADLPLAEARVARAHFRLATLLGENPQTFVLPDKKLKDYPLLPVIPEGLPIRLVRQRPDVMQKEFEMRAAAADIGVAIGEMLPRVQITGSAGFRSAESEEWFTSDADEWSIGSALKVPLLDGGRTYAQLETRRSMYRSSVAAYRQQILTSLEEINGSLVTAVKNRERRSALVEASAAATDALRIAREQYRAGLIDLLDYLDAQRTELRARQVVVLADRTIVTDAVNMYRSLGGGWATDAADPVAPMDKSLPRTFAENFPLFAVGLTPEDRYYPEPPKTRSQAAPAADATTQPASEPAKGAAVVAP
jgi:NodT family efflux transporter outer membrane factor (OMF) lipoprotein